MPQPDTMVCPLCATKLTASDRDSSGRFHCTASVECRTSAESQRGWIARRVPIVQQTAQTGGGLAPIDAPSWMFSVGANGKGVTRERACECGRRFTQRLLSERFLAIVEHRGQRAMGLMTQQIPGYFVPVHCPPCERRDLGHAARIADAHHDAKEPKPTFGEAAD